MAWVGAVFGFCIMMIGIVCTIGAIALAKMDAITGCGLFAVGGLGIMVASLDMISDAKPRP